MSIDSKVRQLLSSIHASLDQFGCMLDIYPEPA